MATKQQHPNNADDSSNNQQSQSDNPINIGAIGVQGVGTQVQDTTGTEAEDTNGVSSEPEPQVTAESVGIDPAIAGERIWDRLPDEPLKLWYPRFQRFLMAGVSRTIRSQYHAELIEKLQKEATLSGTKLHDDQIKQLKQKPTPGSWLEAARRWDWVKRATAYDEEQRRIDNRRWEERRTQLREQEWDVANKLLEKANKMLEMPVLEQQVVQEIKSKDGTKIEQTIVFYPAKWSWRDIPGVVETASKIARLAAEMATERRAQENTQLGADGMPVDPTSLQMQLDAEIAGQSGIVIYLPDNKRNKLGDKTPTAARDDVREVLDLHIEAQKSAAASDLAEAEADAQEADELAGTFDTADLDAENEPTNGSAHSDAK